MIHPLGARASVYDSRLSFLLSLFFLSWTLTPPVSQEENENGVKNFDLRPFGIRTRTKSRLNRHNSLSFYLNKSFYLFLCNFDWKFFFSTLKKFDRFETILSIFVWDVIRKNYLCRIIMFKWICSNLFRSNLFVCPFMQLWKYFFKNIYI